MLSRILTRVGILLAVIIRTHAPTSRVVAELCSIYGTRFNGLTLSDIYLFTGEFAIHHSGSEVRPQWLDIALKKGNHYIL